MITPTKPPALLVFAGLDPSGGAGLVADIQTATALGAHVLPVATTLTSQSLTAFDSNDEVSPDVMESQVRAVTRDFYISTVKLGAVPSLAALDRIIAIIHEQNPAHVVIDPVRITSSGGQLSNGLSDNTYLDRVLSTHPILTPNRSELDTLCPSAQRADSGAQTLIDNGARAVLVTDGDGDGDQCKHRLYLGAGQTVPFDHPRLEGSYRGSGCTLSTAIASELMLGQTIEGAVRAALQFTFRALATSTVASADGRVRVPNRKSTQ